MAEERMAFPDGLRKGEEPAEDPLRQIVRWAVQELMEAEVAAQIGAERYERTDERSTQRNGYRPRTWDTRVGSLELQIPKLRQGSYLPGWLEPRRRAEQALVAVIAEASVQGVSPRKVEAVLRLLGALLAEQNDEWLVGRHYFSETSMHQLLHPPPGTPVPMALETSAS